MRIINLIENSEGRPGCAYAHGLSFYVETELHNLLLDLGPSEETIRNAETMGIDLSTIDTVVLSHGHYDHSGGIMLFSKINENAVIYMQQTAAGEYYADEGESPGKNRYKFIGIDRRIAALPQVRFLKGDYTIDEELKLFTIRKRTHALPFANKRLMVKVNGRYVRDEFAHEQFLVIRDREEGKNILMSGCAHNGILSILDAYMERYGAVPDAVISGFHLMKKTEYNDEELGEIRKIAEELTKYPAKFITCHCTGIPAYEEMKSIMGEQLGTVHSGEEVRI